MRTRRAGGTPPLSRAVVPRTRQVPATSRQRASGRRMSAPASQTTHPEPSTTLSIQLITKRKSIARRNKNKGSIAIRSDEERRSVVSTKTNRQRIVLLHKMPIHASQDDLATSIQQVLHEDESTARTSNHPSAKIYIAGHAAAQELVQEIHQHYHRGM
jgi:hypothetical protein